MPGKSPTQRIEELSEQLRKLEAAFERQRAITDLKVQQLEASDAERVAAMNALLARSPCRLIAVALSDLVGDPRPLLRPALWNIPRGVRALIAIPAPEHRRTFIAAGFLPSRTTLHLLGKPLAGELDRDLRSWRFALGDTDFF